MNSKSITAAARAHMGRVKESVCVVCSAPPPSEAHHILQGCHFLTLPLCTSCHTSGFNGIHGQARIWKALKKTEMSCLDDTIRSLYTGA